MILNSILPHYSSVYGSKSLNLLKVLRYLGTCNRLIGRYSIARRHLKQGLSIIRDASNGRDVREGLLLGRLGNIYWEEQRYAKAKEYLERSFEIYQKYYHPNHPKMAWILGYLGKTYVSLGDHTHAKKVLMRALHIHNREYGSESIYSAWVLGNLGRMEHSLVQQPLNFHILLDTIFVT